MRKITKKVWLTLFLVVLIAGIAAGEERLKIIPASESIGNLIVPKENTVTLEEAKNRTIESGGSMDNVIDYGQYTKPANDVIEEYGIAFADDIWALAYGSEITKNNSEKYGYSAATVYRTATMRFNPYENSSIQDTREKSAQVALALVIIALLYTSIRANLSFVGFREIDRLQWIMTQTVSTFSEYKRQICYAILGFFGLHYVLVLILNTNFAMTDGIMQNALDYIPLSWDNWIVYLIMAVCYLFEGFFFVIRYILMSVIAGSDYILGALFGFDFVRNFVIETVKYYTKITFLQFIICLITFFGVVLIDQIPFVKDLAAVCLMVIVLAVSGVIVFGFTNLFKVGKTVIKAGSKL